MTWWRLEESMSPIDNNVYVRFFPKRTHICTGFISVLDNKDVHTQQLCLFCLPSPQDVRAYLEDCVNKGGNFAVYVHPCFFFYSWNDQNTNKSCAYLYIIITVNALWMTKCVRDWFTAWKMHMYSCISGKWERLEIRCTDNIVKWLYVSCHP